MVAKREEWLELLPENSVGAEVGVMEGRFSRSILDIAKPRLLYLVDHWTSNLPGEKGKTRHLRQGGNLRTTLREVRSEIATGQVRLVVAFSVDAAKMVPDASLDWVYIDAHHTFEAVTEDCGAWYSKVKTGGIIAGHDYHQGKIRRAVAEFMETTGAQDLQLTTEPEIPGVHSPPTYWWTKT